MVVSLASVVVLAVIGGVLTGIPMARLAPGIASATFALSEDLRREIGSRVLSISIAARTAIALGIVSLMVRKPDLMASVIVIGVAAMVGIAVGAFFGPARVVKPVVAPEALREGEGSRR
jgi:hypothetical protein